MIRSKIHRTAWRAATLGAGIVALLAPLASLGAHGCASTVHGSTDHGLSDSGTSSPSPSAPALLPVDDASPLQLLGDAATTPNVVSGFTGPLPGPFTDFPGAPILDAPDAGTGGVPTQSATLFGPPSQGAAIGGPCLIEPEIGALFPSNWLRPRFAWTASNGDNLFELRVHADNQANDLVVYTAQTRWTMPVAMWSGLSAHSQGVPMTVTVRGGQLNGGRLANEASGSSGPIGIAPVTAPGTIVYWAIVNGGQTGELKGFRIGDETVGSVLTAAQVRERGAGGLPCIGCHASTPDGLNVGFSVGYPEGTPGAYTDSIATLGMDASPGLVPPFLTPDGKSALDALGGIPTYSPAHWASGDRIVLLSDSGELHWVNLEGVGPRATGVVSRGAADTHLATDPTWSRDGVTIVYTSAQGVFNGRQAGGPMDLFSVPYNGGAGGAAAPVAGASQPGVDEYYPSLSPDARYVIFNRAPTGDNPYSDPQAQLYVVPTSGSPSGQPVRLGANDPPACSGRASPGVTNSWAKWSPTAGYVPVLGNTYYWIVFSSTRYPTGPAQGSPQLYVSAIVVDAQGKMTTYPSLYLWNQPPGERNHTPAWDVFQIPPAPPANLQ